MCIAVTGYWEKLQENLFGRMTEKCLSRYGQTMLNSRSSLLIILQLSIQPALFTKTSLFRHQAET
jgi:hypothetical protein